MDKLQPSNKKRTVTKSRPWEGVIFPPKYIWDRFYVTISIHLYFSCRVIQQAAATLRLLASQGQKVRRRKE